MLHGDDRTTVGADWVHWQCSQNKRGEIYAKRNNFASVVISAQCECGVNIYE